jgi:hypothetical protein
LKPEWCGSPLAQEQKYQGRKKPVTRKDDDNNNNNNIYCSSYFLIPQLRLWSGIQSITYIELIIIII